MITSTSNAQVKNIILLQKKQKARKEQGAFVIEGSKMFLEAKQLGLLKRTFVSEHYFKSLMDTDPSVLQSVEYEVVEDKVFDQMADTVTPQGIMAIVSMPSYRLDDMVRTDVANLILLEDLRDPGNLGTIIRTAEAAGVTGIIMSKETVDLFNPKVIRSTMGSIYRMPYIYVEDFHDTLNILKTNQFDLFATHLSGQNYYDQENYNGKCGIIIGNEAHGITEETAKAATTLVKIPMNGHVESLNAAIAASVIMYEVFRQKRNK